MTEAEIIHLLQEYKAGTITEDDAVKKIVDVPFEEMRFAEVDHHRELRQGMPEVIYAAGKTPAQVRDIFYSLYTHSEG